MFVDGMLSVKLLFQFIFIRNLFFFSYFSGLRLDRYQQLVTGTLKHAAL